MITFDDFVLAHHQPIDCTRWHGLVDGIRVSLYVELGSDTEALLVELTLGDRAVVGLNWPGCYWWPPEMGTGPDALSDENRQAVEDAVSEFRRDLDAYLHKALQNLAAFATQRAES